MLFGAPALVMGSALGLLGVNIVVGAGAAHIEDVASVKPAYTAVVFGAGVYEGGRLSPMLADRVDTAIDLYTRGKVKKLLMTGDHGRDSYDETNAMKEFATSAGVPEADIFTDHAGFSTYDSLYRARDIFKVRRVVLVTQEFHLPRALYIGGALGLKVEGVSADRRDYWGMSSNLRRESFANIKAVWQVLTRSKPKFLGEPIPITGDSGKSRG